MKPTMAQGTTFVRNLTQWPWEFNPQKWSMAMLASHWGDAFISKDMAGYGWGHVGWSQKQDNPKRKSVPVCKRLETLGWFKSKESNPKYVWVAQSKLIQSHIWLRICGKTSLKKKKKERKKKIFIIQKCYVPDVLCIKKPTETYKKVILLRQLTCSWYFVKLTFVVLWKLSQFQFEVLTLQNVEKVKWG